MDSLLNRYLFIRALPCRALVTNIPINTCLSPSVNSEKLEFRDRVYYTSGYPITKKEKMKEV